MQEIELKHSVEVMAATLEFFHDQNGGIRLLPELCREETQTDIAKFLIIDGESRAAITFRPTDNSGSIMKINPNETELWGMILGVHGRCELGINTYLGAETSSACVTFCNDFVDYLKESNYISEKTTNGGKRNIGRPSCDDDLWAIEEIKGGREPNDVFAEWVNRPGVVERKLADKQDRLIFPRFCGQGKCPIKWNRGEGQDEEKSKLHRRIQTRSVGDGGQ